MVGLTGFVLCNKLINHVSFLFQGLDGHGKPILVLHLRVQFYVDSPRLLRYDPT